MRKRYLAVCLAVLTLVFAQCGDNGVEPETELPVIDQAKADSIAQEVWNDLVDTLSSMENIAAEEFRNIRFEGLRADLQRALDEEKGNELANLGMAIIELLEINYSEDIWEFVDSISTIELNWLTSMVPQLPDFAANRNRTLIGNQFQLMVEMPMVMVASATTFPPNVKITTFQDLLLDEVIPKLSNAIDHVNVVERQDTALIRLCEDYDEFTECLVIDLGEIKTFNAALYALRSALYCATAYDLDLVGPDGTYDWMDYLSDEYIEMAWELGYLNVCCDAEVIEGVSFDTLNIFCYYFDDATAPRDSVLLRVGYYNLEEREGFLGLRDGGSPLQNAHDDMLEALDKLEDAAAFIRNRTDETEENVIKLADLTDFDSDLDDPGNPNFMDGWTQLEDVVAFGRDLLNGPVSFTEEIGPMNTEYTWRMDIGRLLSSPVDDWNELLPHHSWNLPSGNWIERVEIPYDEYSRNPENNYWALGRLGNKCVELYYSNIGYVREDMVEWHLLFTDPVVLIDDVGAEIDPNVTFPYFSDYTFNGIFPDMTSHDDWQNLYNILK